MKPRKFILSLLIVSSVLAAVAPWVSAQSTTNQSSRDQTSEQRRKVPFLKPIPSPFVISSDDPRQPSSCRLVPRPLRCPPLLLSGGTVPTIDPALKARLPHVRVTIVIKEIVREDISDGVMLAILYPWRVFTTSSTASVESGGPYAPDVVLGSKYTPEIVIYDALVFNACESFSSFHIRHESVIFHGFSPPGSFVGEDNSTLNATGYYNVQFTVRVDPIQGPGVSDFHFSGIISVLCSSATSLPG